MNNANLNVNSGEVTAIRLYGHMGKLFGRVHYMAVATAAEAVRALCTQLPGFERYLNESEEKGYGFAVFYGKTNLAQDDLKSPAFGDDIRIAPIVFGSKKGGWFQVIVGVVLVVVGAVINYFAPGAGVPFMKFGYAMIIGGVVQLLSPTPKGMSARDKADNQASYNFNGPLQTSAQGNPVMVLYGENISGSAILSAGINAEDQAYIPRLTPAEGSGGGGGGGSATWSEES